MDKFTTLNGIAAPMALVNIDTDMIIPKQFLKTIKRLGLGVNLFDEMRYNQDGSEKPDFVLNKPAYRDASIIVAGDNFGCGSSREHAPWAIADFGIRCVISTSFADIFFNNCFKNGVLPIVLDEKHIEEIFSRAASPSPYELTVNLKEQTVEDTDGLNLTFEIDPSRKHNLLHGLDDIAETLQLEEKISAYEEARSW